MKVLHYIPSIDRSSGGVGSYMQLLSKELGELVELHVITHQSENDLQLKKCHVHYISRCWWQPRKVKKQFIKIMNRVNPDVFHVNTCWFPIAAYTAIWNHKELHVPMVYSPHGMLEPWILKRNYWLKKLPALMLYQRKALRVANVLHATADSEKDNLLRLGYNKNVEVVANGIDVDGIDLKISWRRSRKILFLSRVHIKKGINFLIDAVSALRNEFADYTITIAGEGDDSYIDDLKRFAQEKNVCHLFEFVGGIYGNKKWDLYQRSDLFVLPTHSENFGIVVAEALASGTPVITTKGTPWEDLETYHCGWWTEIGTEGTVGALKDFLQKDEKELEEMGRKGRKLIEEKYSNKKIAKDMVKLYESLINKNKKSRQS